MTFGFFTLGVSENYSFRVGTGIVPRGLASLS